VHVLSTINEADAYFGRLEALYLDARLNFGPGANRHWKRHPWQGLRAKGLILAQALLFLIRLSWQVRDPALRRYYLKRIWRMFRSRPDPRILWIALVKTALQYHAQRMAKQMAAGQTQVINTYS
jgi:hypothetical protein